MVKELKTIAEVEEFENQNFDGNEQVVSNAYSQKTTTYYHKDMNCEVDEIAGYRSDYQTIDDEGVIRSKILFLDENEKVIARYEVIINKF